MITSYLSGWIHEILSGKRRSGKRWITFKTKLDQFMKKKILIFCLDNRELNLLDKKVLPIPFLWFVG